MAELIALEQARQIVLDHTQVLGTETVGIVEALGRVAACALTSDIDVASFATAAMDGYALRAAQLADASAATPVELDVIAEVAAGDWYEGTLDEGQCVRIMTGAALPVCTDTVVKYEVVDVVEGDGKPGSRVAFTDAPKLGRDVRQPGDEARAGEVIVTRGEVINSGGVGFLAGCGVTEVETYRHPRVAIMATGSELVDPSEVPTHGKIRNSNSSSIAACVVEAGGVPTVLPIVRDDYDVLLRAVRDACAGDYDLVLTTGGACGGDFDFVEQVVEVLGETYVTAINMRPGKAETYGHVNGIPVFGLPGNPSAAYMGFQMLVRPAMRKMQGYSCFDRVRIGAKLACDVRAKKDARMTLARAIIEKGEDGGYIVRPVTDQSSALFGPLQRSNALLVIPRGDEGHAAGETMQCIMLDIPEESAL